ncbi:MAG: 30S ribosomal protein S20 [Chloroflexi bacterium]|nr:30S ribosomal protein S20 [Chloroflexota bacterium]MBM3153925.1 30S ribosomal protein S20 [Chloroflexota bacterium]MBM3172968.1 30S ribosomal protein S20 [Chloroflexota bacterium]MBM3175275.1 30S ribosomal protein S20 [Chloroflexota bacterium]MBM4450076.1 30S ribosomal protein S20 [Chloroflexota bacterium]
MPKETTSAEKAARAAERKSLRNKSIKSETKTRLARVEELVESKDIESAKQATVVAISTLDRAAKKGAIHPNTAARRKSRLMKKVNKAAIAQASPAEPRKTPRARKPKS